MAQITYEPKRFDEFRMQPEVWHFVKPVEGQVDGKGDLSLSIPVLTVPGTNGMNFEVVFSYKAGILYHQTASWIGLGWNFDPGSITRDAQGNLQVGGTNFGPDYENFSTRQYMPDVYYVTLPGRGTVPMGRSTISNFNSYPPGPNGYLHPDNGQYGFYIEDYRPYKVEYELSAPGEEIWWPEQPTITIKSGERDIKKFIITTEDGVKYIFGLPSLALHKDYLGSGIPPHYYAYPNAWRLLAIVGRDYAGDIDLLLQDASVPPEASGLDLYVDWIKFEYGHGSELFSGRYINSHLVQNTYLKKITTPTHYAIFDTGLRADIDLQNYPNGQGGTDNITQHYKKLTEIVLYTKNGTVVKKVELAHDYYLAYNNTIGTPAGKLTLKQIKFKSHDNQPLPGYDFEYMDGLDNPVWDINTNSWYYDGWGYYNDKLQPRVGIDTNPDDAEAWSLKKITYPTGATEEYEYENDFINDDLITYYISEDQGGQGTWQPATFDFTQNFGLTTCRRQGGIRVMKITRRDGMGNSLEVNFSYGNGHTPSIPPKLVPWFIIPDMPIIHINEYQVVNRGNQDVVYEWVKRTYPDQSQRIDYYATESYWRQKTLVSSYGTSPLWLFHGNNHNFFWGLLSKTEMIRGDFKEIIEYQYSSLYRNAGIMFPATSPYGETFEIWQYSHLVNHEIQTSERISQPPHKQVTTIDRTFTQFTRQLKTTTTTTSDRETKEEITYAHEISDYGGTTWNPTALQGMRSQNILTPVSQRALYFKNLLQPGAQFIVQTSTISTYQEAPKWPPIIPESPADVWKIHRRYALNTAEQLTVPPFFNNWSGGNTPDSRWQLKFDITAYKYGEVIEVKDGNSYLLEIFYGDNANNLVNNDNPNDFAHAYITGIHLNNFLTREFDYDTRFLQVNAIKDEAGNTQSFIYDNFGRLQSHKDANNATLAEYAYYFSRLPGGAFDPANPNSIKTTLHYSASPVVNTDTYEYYDGRAQKIQTLTRATDESNDYYGALDLDLTGRIEKEYKTYRKPYNPGNPPPPQYDPNFASIQGDKFTEYHYNSLLDEELTRVDFPGPQSDENSTRHHYRFVSADQELPQLYANSGITWKRQAVIDENGNETAVFTDESGNKILERRYEGCSFDTVSVRAYCNGLEEDCTHLDQKTFQIEYAQTINWNCHIDFNPNYNSSANFKIYKSGQVQNPIVLIEEQGYFSGKETLQPGSYVIEGYAEWQDSHHGAGAVGEGSVIFESSTKPALLTTTHFDYDGAGNLITVRPPNYFTPPPGSQTSDWVITNQYNTLGQLTQKTSPDAGTARYKYDPNGNLRFSQDARQAIFGKVSFMQYDFNNRPVLSGEAAADFNTLDPAAAPYAFENTSANWITVNQYDSYPANIYKFPWSELPAGDYPPSSALANIKGRLLATAHKSNGTWQVTLYSYDKNGRVINKYILTTGLAKTTLAYSYNLQGLPLQTQAQTGSNAFYHFNVYNRLGQLTEVKTSQGSSQPSLRDLRYSYNPTGTVAEQKVVEYSANNYRLTLPFSYHVRDWLIAIGDVAGANQKFAALYTHLPNGNIQKAEFLNSALASEKRYRYEYSYDPLSRLLGADYAYYSGNWVSSNKYDLSGLGYDANGNILSLMRRKENGDFIDHLGYSYNRTNRLQSVADAVSASAEDWDAEDCAFTYDANGNVISMTENGQPAISNIQYDDRNLPISLVNRAGQTVNYRYNAAGQRIYKQVGSNPAEHYILDEDRILGIFRGSGLLYWNIYGNDGIVGRLEVSIPPDEEAGEGAGGEEPGPGAPQKLFYLKDHLGSTRAVMNTNGAVTESYDYYPFGLKMPGRIYPATPTVTKNLFTGKERDSETNWDYFGARYYHSALGRWLTVDPLADQYPSLSPYVYAANNPLFFIDPTGQVLSVAGDSTQSANILQFISGLSQKEFTSRYSVNEGVISFDFSGLDITGNEGLKLLQQLVTSKKAYLFEIRQVTQAETGGLGVVNRSETPRNPWSTSGEPLPAGFDAHVVVGTNVEWFDPAYNLPVTIENIAFHELAESYSRTDLRKIYGVGPGVAERYGVKPFEGAHFDAFKRHQTWATQGRTFLPIHYPGQQLRIIFK